MGDSEAPSAGGFPCYYMLLMKYVTSFLTTFLIYFLVFGYLDYKGIIGKIMDFLLKIVLRQLHSVNTAQHLM